MIDMPVSSCTRAVGAGLLIPHVSRSRRVD